MIIEGLVTPEELANREINIYIPEIIQEINKQIKMNLRYSENGPFSCFGLTDLFDYTYQGKMVKLSIRDPLLNKILEKVKKLYQGVGWIVWEDFQTSNSKDEERYLTFSSDIWKEKNDTNR